MQEQIIPKSLEKISLDYHELQRRAAICDECQHNKGVTREKNNFPVYIVRCGLCGCSGLSLRNGVCKADKWKRTDATSAAPAASLLSHKKKLLLRAKLSPGDIVTLTTAVRDLHLAYPDEFSVAVDTTAPELWDHNPYLVQFDKGMPGIQIVTMHYPLINQSNQRPYHFIHGYTQFLESKLKLRIPLTSFKGDIHLSVEEAKAQPQVEKEFGFKGPYWIIVAGGKQDFTAKWWSPSFYQDVVDHFRGRIQFVQCGEKHHWHPRLNGVYDMIGKTTLRQFVKVMYNAAGVICPVTFAMHLAAAVPTKNAKLRPCVVIAGGREPAHWEQYPGHQFLHTIGALPCCATGGCWKSRCQAIGDGDLKDRSNMCERPVQIEKDLRIPQCMMLIRPSDVISSIEKYLVN